MLNKLAQPFEVTVTGGGAWKTLAAVKAHASVHLAILGLDIHGNSVNGAAKRVKGRLRRITAANGTGTSQTPVPTDKGRQIAPLSTGRVNFTVQPTDAGNSTGDVIFNFAFHPQGGRQFDWSIKPKFDIPAGTELALEAFVESGESDVIFTGTLDLEE